MGARPVACMDALRFGPPDDPENGPANRRVVRGVVEGIAPLRQLLRRAHGRRRMLFRLVLQREPLGQTFLP